MDRHTQLMLACIVGLLAGCATLAQDTALTACTTNHITLARPKGCRFDAVHVSTDKSGWRFAYKDQTLYAVPFYAEPRAETWTPWTLIEAPTLAEVTQLIAKLRLRLRPDQVSAINDLAEKEAADAPAADLGGATK